MLNDQQVLERMDQWYFSRMERAYTPEVEQEVMEKVESGLRSDPEFISELGFLVERIVAKFNRDKQLEIAKTHFSSEYAQLEQLLSVVEYANLSGIVEPLRERYQRVRGFVDKVRQSAENNEAGKIHDDDIDRAFLEVYTSYDNYRTFYLVAAEHTLLLLEVLDPSSVGLLREGRLVLKDTGEGIRYLLKAVLGDLEERKREILT